MGEEIEAVKNIPYG